ITPHIRPDVLRGQQAHGQVASLAPAAPVMRGAAGFHDHFGTGRKLLEKSLERPATQPLPRHDPSRAVRDGYFEHVPCEIDRHRLRIDVGLPVVVAGRPRSSGQILPRETGEESMPSRLLATYLCGDVA